VLASERQIAKFYVIHIRALIVKIQGRTNRCTVSQYKDLQLKH